MARAVISKRSANRARTVAQGATRKLQEAPAAKPDYAAWCNRLLVLAGTAAVLVAGVHAFLFLRALPVEHIRVSGELEHIQAEAIQELVQPALAGGFLSADLVRIRRQLEQLPWVYRVTVRRRWPSALEIQVVEQLPIARWGEQGFLNHSGEVFSSARVADQQTLPLLRGPEGTASALMASYLRLIALLEPVGLAVNALEVDERGQLEAGLAGGMRLVMGNHDFRERLQRFVAVYPLHLAARAGEIERVDLRYESGLAVAFAESADETDAAAEPEKAPSRVAGL
jgi:cell division protein FtsQ